MFQRIAFFIITIIVLAFVGPTEMRIYDVIHCCQDQNKIADLAIAIFVVISIWGVILTNAAEIIFIQLNDNKKEGKNE
jgi:uncharacterized membrane protein